MKKWLYPSIILNIILIVALILFNAKQSFSIAIESVNEELRVDARDSYFSTFYSTPTDIVFLGDSLTDYFEWAEAYPTLNVKNRGLAGDTSAHVLSRMDTVLLLQPDKIFLMIGVNDFKQEDVTPYDTAENIRSIIQYVKLSLNQTTLYVQSILPSTRDPEGIVLANCLVQQICEEENITYIDLHPLFAQEDNTIKPEMTYDNLHLSSYGYWTWLQAIDAYVYE